ncbi:MAG: vitamin B12-dependent ribonucleotide reductase [Ignavibacteriales bacterium]|nr:vitamin B12-dependent ribonucleotide reductase [Ignavibacteriales bacterium]
MAETRVATTSTESAARLHTHEQHGLTFQRCFSTPGVHPFDEVEWELRTAVISNEKGEKVFEQKDVEIPKSWSMTATNVVVSKYFHGQIGMPDRETSVKQLIERVARTYYLWGLKGGYFTSQDDAEIFYNELCFLFVNQYTAFNSPVWFNVGVEERPQCSACFINSVKDSMGAILDLAKTEGMLFNYGSGTGSNLSTLRSSKERLSGGGTASGPVSFMKGFDAFAGVIKSGGKTRRAAKMVILNIDHPDVPEFINCKSDEEKKAWALIDAGYDGGFNVPGGAYDSISYQNANHSVRVTDEFMRAVLEDKEWWTTAVTTGKPLEKFRARDLMRRMADAAWVCGDPGIQYDTTINNWHTCSTTARINSSNPCSEYMFLDDTACNLASLNLMKFRREDGTFDVEAFQKAVQFTITAMEISVDNSSYPTPAITQNSFDFRPLGLGYANLGALLMSRGIAYDSPEGRDLAAAITSLMCGEAYKQSALIAKEVGPFKYFNANKEPFMKVMAKHGIYAEKIDKTHVQDDLWEAQTNVWNDVVQLGSEYGIKNSQTTVLAPTGTIGFMMDCDTTGVEPDIALVKYKKLVGGGLLKIVNNTVPEALVKLGYDQEQVEHIIAYIDKNDTIEGAPHLKEEHLSVFDCAFKPAKGKRSIQYMGHIRMMSAVQPFLSGAISKTVNMPTDVTIEDIENAYIEAWKLGLKAVAVYRDGCKRTQPLSTSLDAKKEEKAGAATPRPARRRLPDERASITHKFSIAGHEGYITVGMFEDSMPGELFITMSKEGSTISGLMDSLATSVSIALQYGVPLKVLVDKFSHARYEPSGFTNNPEIPIAKSVSDYIFRWLGRKFLQEDGETPIAPALSTQAVATPKETLTVAAIKAASVMEKNEKVVFEQQADAPPCHNCGSIMIRSGSCYKCLDCGSTSGCS